MPTGCKVNIVLEDGSVRMFRGCAGQPRRILKIAGHLISLLPQGSLFSLNKGMDGIYSPSRRDS